MKLSVVLRYAPPAWALGMGLAACVLQAENPPAFPEDPAQVLERTSFQTSQPWSPRGNLRADVAMVYGIGNNLEERVKSWRDRGYRVHLMTGVSWGEYQDYLYGRYDGLNHEDNAQTDKHGNKISHGRDVYYMCPVENFGEYLSQGVQRALDAGVEAIHLEEPEFWARAGWSEAFKREWKSYYQEDWVPPDSSPDAQWRASKLKYYLYRRALQQVFDHVRRYNEREGKQVRCYVPTHSLLNYAHWCIVSPESSLARLEGCHGCIAQVWTGTARTPNYYRGRRRERTFETAFLEYGAMKNLVRATGREVWFLNDPIEDNPRHDWTDYRVNWESTLTASLLHPEVWKYEVAPWPERVFGGRYPHSVPRSERQLIPPAYATELQVVMHALADMKQERVEWDCGTAGIGILVSDSLMFQREQPMPSDPNMAQLYGQMLPLLKRGLPITPVQLENVSLPGFLDDMRVLVLSYEGQKPLRAEVHEAVAQWVEKGGVLVVVDDDRDPYNHVREWWNEEGKTGQIPRRHLFAQLGLTDEAFAEASEHFLPKGAGAVAWMKESPVQFSLHVPAERRFIATMRRAVEKARLTWRETNYLLLRRGPYLIGAGLDEAVQGEPKTLTGRFVNLFDPELKMVTSVALTPGARVVLLDLEAPEVATPEPRVLASAGKALPDQTAPEGESRWTVEGVGETPAVVLVASARPPREITLEGQPVSDVAYDAAQGLLHVRFPNEPRPRTLRVVWEP